jgi:dolichyl-phosphate-mannose--protein O-mannosyl transferase
MLNFSMLYIQCDEKLSVNWFGNLEASSSSAVPVSRRLFHASSHGHVFFGKILGAHIFGAIGWILCVGLVTGFNLIDLSVNCISTRISMKRTCLLFFPFSLYFHNRSVQYDAYYDVSKPYESNHAQFVTKYII